ncbi:hypothetical protein HK096_009531 [Nowakowskiella sp. JEL0078]|nr:hypothetical protein HK096_009531 [Nowakowskiella sp. JEL0078]
MPIYDRNQKTKQAQLQCQACNVSFSSQINALSHQVDVYHQWVDACERLNKSAVAVEINDIDQEDD